MQRKKRTYSKMSRMVSYVWAVSFEWFLFSSLCFSLSLLFFFFQIMWRFLRGGRGWNTIPKIATSPENRGYTIMHCLYHVRTCIRLKYKNHETNHHPSTIWAKVECLRNNRDGLAEDGLFYFKHDKQEHKCMGFRVYTLSWTFGTRNQGILSRSINT